MLVNLFNIFGAYRRRKTRVIHLENGLVYTDGSETLTLPYDQIASTRLERKGANRNRYYVYYLMDRRTERELALSGRHIAEVDDLGDTVMEEVTDLLFARAEEAIQRGETVEIGEIGISQQGLHGSEGLLHWKEIESAQFQAGTFTITQNGKQQPWFQEIITGMPNAMLLLRLVDEGVNVEGL